jgi:hypothetical protein
MVAQHSGVPMVTEGHRSGSRGKVKVPAGTVGGVVSGPTHPP